MAQLTITVTRSIVISGLPEGLTATEQQEIADEVAAHTQVENEDLEYVANELDLAGDWTVVEQPLSAPITVEATEG